MVVCEIALAVVGLPDDISFGVIHTSRLFALHAEELTVGAYLKYAPPREISVRDFVDEFHFITTKSGTNPPPIPIAAVNAGAHPFGQ